MTARENYTVVSSIFCKLYLKVFDFLTFILQRPQFCKNYTLGLLKNRISFYTLGLGVRPNFLTPLLFLLEVPPGGTVSVTYCAMGTSTAHLNQYFGFVGAPH